MDPQTTPDAAKMRILQAALPHVAFDGWSQTTLTAAIHDSGVAPALARALFPRGGVDLALAYHHDGDARMTEALKQTDLTAQRYRDRIATAVKLRLTLADRELVRRATALFALPQHALDGTRALWATADAIWTALGDTSTDLNWYTKRATLSAVHAATTLYWLGDDSADQQASWDFLDRRIDNVMGLEKSKANFRDNPLGKALLAGPLKILATIHAPKGRQDLPGHMH